MPDFTSHMDRALAEAETAERRGETPVGAAVVAPDGTVLATGGNRYQATGELMIRGRTRPIDTTITLEIGDDEAHAAGSLRLDRTDYWLGIGPSALFVDIGREVAVRFDLTARPVN